MTHVFVETNWVVAYAAPAHHKLQIPAAPELLDRAAAGELTLHLPSICISEARRPLHQDFQAQTTADRVRQFLLWAREEQHITIVEDDITRRALDKMEGFVKRDLARLEDTLASLRKKPGLDIFDITHQIAERTTELSFRNLALKPFDQMILAAVLVRSEELHRSGETDLAFCSVDADLQPWDRLRNPKPLLKSLYENARVWVYGDFLLQAPAKPEGWPK
jgi:hypothetical protein